MTYTTMLLLLLMLLTTSETMEGTLDGSHGHLYNVTVRPDHVRVRSVRAIKQKYKEPCIEYDRCPSVNDSQPVPNCHCDTACSAFGDCCSNVTRVQPALDPHLYKCRKIPGYGLIPIYVINDCPNTDDGQHYRESCLGGPPLNQSLTLDDVIYSVPVTSPASSLVYRNVFCAACHGQSDVTFWSATYENASGHSWKFSPPSDGPKPRLCVSDRLINNCPSDASASDWQMKCEGPERKTLYVYYGINVYRNLNCAKCNNVSEDVLACYDMNSKSAKPELVNGFVPFSIMFDFNRAKGDMMFVSGSTNNSRPLADCPKGHIYDPFKSICRYIPKPLALPQETEFNTRDENNILTSRNRLHCTMVTLQDPSEYELLANGSVYVALYQQMFEPSEYKFAENDSIEICAPFSADSRQDPALSFDRVATYLSVVGSVVSLVALAFQFFVYIVFPVLRNTPGRCVICLVVSLFVGQLFFLLVADDSSARWCFVQSFTMHFAFLAAFFWMNIMAVDVYRTFGSSTMSSSSTFGSARRRFAVYSVYVWLSSFLVVFLGVMFDILEVGGSYRPYYGLGLCWFNSRNGLLVFFIVPISLLLIVNIVLFGGSVRKIHTAAMASQMAVQKSPNSSLVVIYVKLSVVMGLGWLIGFLAAFIDWSFLWYVFIVINTLQGLFICLAFVATRQVRRLFNDKLKSLRVSTGVTTAHGTPSAGQQSDVTKSTIV